MAEPKHSGERKSFRQYCEENPRVSYLLTQWHPTKNGALTPDSISQSSRMPVWWLCRKGHEWQTQAASRLGGTGCPMCRAELLQKRREEKIKSAEERLRIRRKSK